jgi:hypothetical protein
MNVYRIESDLDYQALIARDLDRYGTIVGSRGFSQQPLSPRWETLDCFVSEPRLPRGDFLYFTVGTFAFSARIDSLLRKMFGAVAELLPITCEGEPYELVNILRRIEPIDREIAIPKLLANKWIVGFEKYAFVPRKLHGESIFTIEDEAGALFTISDHGDAERDFYRRYRELGLKGLNFELVWRQE